MGVGERADGVRGIGVVLEKIGETCRVRDASCVAAAEAAAVCGIIRRAVGMTICAAGKPA